MPPSLQVGFAIGPALRGPSGPAKQHDQYTKGIGNGFVAGYLSISGRNGMQNESVYRLNASRKELLDLGLRNPLINHRTRAKQVKVVGESSAAIYQTLVADGRKMGFVALPENKVGEQLSAEKEEENGEDLFANQEDLLEQPDECVGDRCLAGHSADNMLQTNLHPEKLQTRLLSIHNDARTYLEEQGVNILFLALGFLYWYEASSSKEARRAPLVLIPVELQRSNAQERFRVLYTGEEIGENLSLREKLKAEFNIKMPDMDTGEALDVAEYMHSVMAAVQNNDRWKVEPDEITLGFFSFGKFLMYKDLDPNAWEGDDHGDGFAILDALLNDGFKNAASEFDDETHIDEVVSPADVHQVMDADSSQVLAILDVNAGHNLVLQGPPGTGKSQTITNIIAESIGNGRKVLFVSEKMAALDVVKRRLDAVGLGDAVLELHSHKTNKKQVLSELYRTLHQGRPLADNPTDDIATYTRLRDELNAYCGAVNRPIGNTHTSFIRALGLALKNHPGENDIQPFDFQEMAAWSESEFRAARMGVEKLARYLGEHGSPNKNPFRSSRLTEFLPSQRPRLENVLEEGKACTESLAVNATKLAQDMGLHPPGHRSEVEIICRAARRAMDAPYLKDLVVSSSLWQEKSDDLKTLLAAGKFLRQAHARYDEWFLSDAWQRDLLGIRRSYVNFGAKWWRFLSGEFRRAKAELQGLCRQRLPKDFGSIMEMLDSVIESQKQREQFDRLSGLGKSLFGVQWKNGDSEWEVLEHLTSWMTELYREIGEGAIPEGFVNFLSGSPKMTELNGKVEQVEKLLTKHGEIMEHITEMLRLNMSDSAKVDWGITLEKQVNYLDYWRKNLDSLFPLVRFNLLAEELMPNGLGFVLTVAKNWPHGENALIKLFDYSWYNGLVEKAYVEKPSIKMFDRTQHAKILEDFTRLDRLLFRHNQARLAARHWELLPNLNGSGELHIINREINKKRRHMPIRKLMSEAGRAIQAIKPVFMMSPMSIATYIPPGSVQFDLVVFDEASQVKPVDAFGAIMRAKQAVVVGDSKQLPPTSFFDTLIDSYDEDDFEDVSDMESVLSLFLGKGAPERMLRWHYRSRHDSLIAVSNYEFYDNRLMVFPSPGANPVAHGLRMHHLPHTAYDRGKSRSNPEEAKIVAKAAMAHARNSPDLTLGIVAFSTAQRDAIELQIERLRRSDPSSEPFFSGHEREPFFVKNLENVQGDERDVIFISIGYGKTAEGYMTMSFGPLNRDGGERRLNVLISRARMAMDVFSNFTADDIDLNRTNARGAVALKNFLAYAQTGNLQQPFSTGKEPDSPFEEEVIKGLVQHGIEVEPQVGTAGFFIDIAVKDPENPGRYLIGIECDGATYHSSRSARDRDRLRQEVLESLGWRLHRIWSTEWYRNSGQELERTLAAIQQAKEDSSHGLNAANPVTKDSSAIIREESTYGDQQGDLKQRTLPYQLAAPYVPLFGNELYQVPPSQLFFPVYEVVAVESPIHRTELVHRITEGAGLKRSGSRIHAAVDAAIEFGVNEGKIVLREGFVWLSEMQTPPVRDRSDIDATSKKVEFVSPEEIRRAISQEVERAFSMSEDDAISHAARALGFFRITEQAKQLFKNQLASMIEDNVLALRNGVVSPGST